MGKVFSRREVICGSNCHKRDGHLGQGRLVTLDLPSLLGDIEGIFLLSQS